MMNNLSWMLYWADVLPGLGTGIGIIGFLGSIAMLIVFIVHIVSAIIGKSDAYDAEESASLAEAMKFSRWALPLMLIVALSSNFIPSRDTFYAIAASEMGEQALKTPIATKAGKALEKWLDDQIADEPKESKE